MGLTNKIYTKAKVKSVVIANWKYWSSRFRFSKLFLPFLLHTGILSLVLEELTHKTFAKAYEPFQLLSVISPLLILPSLFIFTNPFWKDRESLAFLNQISFHFRIRVYLFTVYDKHVIKFYCNYLLVCNITSIKRNSKKSTFELIRTH